MYKVFKATKAVGGSLAYQDGLIDSVLEDLASQLNDKKSGVISVAGFHLVKSDTDVHAVALVEVENAKKK